jgi:hypothetical protein
MRRALTNFAGAFAVLLTAAPVAAQTVVSAYPPLSPAEAVAVLRASHSASDLTDVRWLSRDELNGPRIVIMNSSPTAGPFGEFAPFSESRRLDGSSYFDPPWRSIAYRGWPYGGSRNRETSHARPSGERSGSTYTRPSAARPR